MKSYLFLTHVKLNIKRNQHATAIKENSVVGMYTLISAINNFQQILRPHQETTIKKFAPSHCHKSCQIQIFKK